MDCMPAFPSNKHTHDCAFVVFDRFSKMAILTPCKKSMIVKATTRIFFEHVWVHFGLPHPIILERDNMFLDAFWSNLWPLMDTKLTKSTTFHTQIDGQMEVVNMIIVHILHRYNSKTPCAWDEIPPYVQHSYNRSLDNSIGHVPF
jgi:hypothetical protein